MGLFDDDYTSFSYDSPDLFGGSGDFLSDYDPFSYESFEDDSPNNIFGGGDDFLSDYDPFSYESFENNSPDLFGGSGDFLSDYDPFSYESFNSDDSDAGNVTVNDMIDALYEDLISTDEQLGGDESMASGDGPLGYGILPGIRNTLFGQGQGPLGGNVLGGGGILGQLLGFGGQGGGQGGGIRSLFGLGGDGGGGFGGSPLLSFLAMKSLLKDQDSGGSVPIGGQAYGGPAFNYQDYQPTNLQPALMPGVGYANMEAPGMMSGGSTDQRPGDITFAKLEPGEFVVQKPAVDAVGIETLRKINSMGNGRSYNG